MARAEGESDDEHLSGSSESESGSEYESGSSGEDDGEEEEEEEEENDDAAEAAAAKKQRVRVDIDAMRRMMVDMDTIKARLQQRFAAERQARTERLAREARERELQDAARRKTEEEARSRRVEASVQTEIETSEQQTQVSQQDVCPPSDGVASASGNVVDAATSATLPAVGGSAGFMDAVPNKTKPDGLSLYDLVKTPGLGLSLKAHSPVRRGDPLEMSPVRSSVDPGLVSPARQQSQGEQLQFAASHGWVGDVSQISRHLDSIVGGDDNEEEEEGDYRASRQSVSIYSERSGHPQQPKVESPLAISRHSDENSASMSNSLVSFDTENQSAVHPDLIRRRDHKFDTAVLFSTSKRPPHSAANDTDKSKTDEQREMEAIQCLLFGR